MIITKLLGLSTVLTKSKKVKLAILGIEMAVLAYALIQQKAEKQQQKDLKR
jgi:mannose/fructose/N-acetylgalactosamine-specific phosphotransferase system component IIC